MGAERSGASLIFAALLAGAPGCEPATPDAPTPPDLDPIQREALMVWAVSDPALSLGPRADELATELAPSAVLAAGAAALSPYEERAAAEAVLEWGADLALAAPGTRLAAEVELLPEVLPEACFDPADPTADPTVATLQSGLRDRLDAWPTLRTLMPDPRAGAFWDVPCTCTPCDGTDAPGLADRIEVLWDVFAEEVRIRQRAPWWWHDVPRTVDDGAPVGAPGLPRQALDLALDVVDAEVPIRTPAARPGGPWGSADAMVARAGARAVAGSLDAVAAWAGPTDALLLSPLDLYAQLREERAAGVAAWVVQVDGGGRTALGGVEELALRVVERGFRDTGRSPTEVLAEAVATRWGLEDDPAWVLARGLEETGHAARLATHPLGVPIAGAGGPVPASLPLAHVDMARFDGAWTERVAAVESPDAAAIVQANQWSREAELGASVALGALAEVEDGMDPADAAALRRRLIATELYVKAWGLLARADITLRAVDGGFDDPRIEGWLADDAEGLEVLADAADDAVVSGDVTTAWPVVPENLRSVAAQLLESTGGAAPQPRGFPVLYRARHDFEDGRINYYWTVDPPGPGWVERGTGFPRYDETSSRGEDAAAWWHAWTTGVPADTKVTWRACTESPEGLVVCSSDRVLWTPL